MIKLQIIDGITYVYEDSGLILGVDWEYDSDGSHIAITDKAKNYEPKRRVATIDEIITHRLELKRLQDEFITDDMK